MDTIRSSGRAGISFAGSAQELTPLSLLPQSSPRHDLALGEERSGVSCDTVAKLAHPSSVMSRSSLPEKAERTPRSSTATRSEKVLLQSEISYLAAAAASSPYVGPGGEEGLQTVQPWRTAAQLIPLLSLALVCQLALGYQ